MKTSVLLPLALLVLLVLAGMLAAMPSLRAPHSAGDYETKTIRIGSETLAVEIVATPAARERGLSGHAPLGAQEGMLFVFEKEDTYGFWMKDMLFPIDIIWINAEGEVVTVASRATPESYPQVLYPSAPALYVLEVTAGFAEQHGIAEGSKLVL